MIHVFKDGQQLGPFSEEQIQADLNQGIYTPQDMAWKEGLPDWIPLEQLFPNKPALKLPPIKLASVTPPKAGPPPLFPSLSPSPSPAASPQPQGVHGAASVKFLDEKDLAPEMPESRAIQLACITGLASALIAGAVWGGIVILTGYEIGWVAWGLGAFTGWGTVVLAKHHRGLPFQVIAMVSVMIGIFIGKFLSFGYFAPQILPADFVAANHVHVSFFSMQTASLFFQNLGLMIRAWDYLWFFLALSSAYKITND